MRLLLCLLPLVALACSDDLTGPTRQLGPFMDYAAAPCAPAIDHDLASWRGTIGEPLSITTRIGGDTSFVRVIFEASAEYAEYWDGTVWQEYHWLPSWTYCIAVRSVGMPDPSAQ